MFGLVKCLLVLTAVTAAHGFALGTRDVIFHLYTKENPTLSQPLLADMNSIMSSNMLPNRRTVMTVHSNNDQGAGGNFNAFVVPAHLQAEDVNVIAVDWIAGASMYSEALGNAPQVGEIIALFINILQNDFGYSPSNIRIVGHGLGGHIAGIAARNVVGNIAHIYAIDPSFHGWTHHPDILKPSDADIVEVLHATSGTLGYDYPLGDLDFYANGGAHQSGCSADVSCSHIYAYAFYAESVSRQVTGGPAFIGTACDSYEDAVAQQCSGARDVHFGGTDPKTGSSGIYWFGTNIVPPFARD